MLFDIHVHCCEARDPRLTRANGTRYPTPEELLASMDGLGIDRALCMGGVSPECRYTVVPAEELLRIAGRYPERLVPCCPVDPRWLGNSPTADFRPLLRAYQDRGCRAVGEYTPNIPLDDPLNLNFLAQVEEVGLPLTFHLATRAGGCYGLIDEPGLPRLEKMLAEFPNITWVGHGPHFWSAISGEDGSQPRPYPKGTITPGGAIDRLMERFDNLYADLSGMSGYNAMTRDPDFTPGFIERRWQRLLFGTDVCYANEALPIIEWMRTIPMDESIRHAIAEGNAVKLLGLGGGA